MSYNKPLLLSVCQGGILRFHGHQRAFKGLLASDGGMLGILLGASPVMCLGVWQMIHTPCRTMSFSVCCWLSMTLCCWSCNNEYVNVCWSCNNEYDNVLLVT